MAAMRDEKMAVYLVGLFDQEGIQKMEGEGKRGE
jgi:hypothetical protein